MGLLELHKVLKVLFLTATFLMLSAHCLAFLLFHTSKFSGLLKCLGSLLLLLFLVSLLPQGDIVVFVLSAHLVKLAFQEFVLSVEVIIFGLEALVILLVLVELVGPLCAESSFLALLPCSVGL